MMIESSKTKQNERLGHGGTEATEKYQFSVFVFSVLSVTPWHKPHFVGVPMHRTTAQRVLADGWRRLIRSLAARIVGKLSARWAIAENLLKLQIGRNRLSGNSWPGRGIGILIALPTGIAPGIAGAIGCEIAGACWSR
ncbi:hypothetical protein BH09PLA1_BH09PLA1_19730 [soil metagenome]